MRTSPWLSVSFVLVCSMAGCSPPSASRYARAADEDGEPWKSLASGKTLAVQATRDCRATWAKSPSELGGGRPLADLEWARAVTIKTVTATRVDADAGLLALELTGAAEPVWIGLRDGSGPCAWSATPAIESALAMAHKRVVFAPWRAQCGSIEVAGTAVDAALVESDPGVAFEIDDVVMGPPSARDFGKSSNAAYVPWLRAKHGSLHVRADGIDRCFVAEGSADAKPPADGLGLVRLDPKRCNVHEGGKHLECRTGLGAWEGSVTNDAVSLRFARRTLGALNLVDGRPMAGGKFAKMVVAFSLAQPKNDAETSLYSALERTMASSLRGDELRVAPANDPTVTLKVDVAVRDLVVGDVRHTDTFDQSEYKDHEETRPNPDKARAAAEVEHAQNAVEQAIENAKQRHAAMVEARNACISACGAMQDANQANICRTSCQVVGTVADVLTSDSGVAEAKTRLTNAQEKLATTPDTIQVPIMAKWRFKKIVHSRPATLHLETAATFRSGLQKTDDNFSFNLEDYDVDADAAHNVTGHRANPDITGAPERTIPLVANAVADKLARNLRASLSKERQESAARAFKESGGAPGKPEFEGVDAIAFEAAGRRLRKATERGTAHVSAKAPSSLPSARVDLAAGECVLAVAVAAAPESAAIELVTRDRSHGDLRKQSVAVVEMCAGELPTKATPDLELYAKEDAQVRWGLYKTSRVLEN